MSQQRALILYHANCLDGFTSAWIAEGTLSQIMDTELHPAQYGKQPPYDLIDASTQVYILDFSYDAATMNEIASQSSSVVLLDHHKTAFENLAGYSNPKVQVIMDNNRSGAGLAWTFFNGTKPMPKLVAYVQDRDLWQFKLTDTQAITEAMYAREFELSEWDSMAKMEPEELAQEGYTLLAKKQKDIASWIKNPLMIFVGGHRVPMLNVPAMYSSDVGHALHEKYYKTLFAGTYQDIQDEDKGMIRAYSLRSSNEGMDVSLIARKYGGGGHRNAAGFTVPISHIDSQGSPMLEPSAHGIEWDNPLEEAQDLMTKALEKIKDALDTEDEED